MSWVRFHTPPKVGGLRSRLWTLDDLTPKERYYYERSRARYEQTEDGRIISEGASAALQAGVIGRIEGFTFIETED